MQTGMLGKREYTLCSPFRANAHNSSYTYFSSHNIDTHFGIPSFIYWLKLLISIVLLQ